MNFSLLTILLAITLVLSIIWHYNHPTITLIKGKTMNVKVFIIFLSIFTFISLVLDNLGEGDNITGIWMIIIGVALAIAIVGTMIERLPERFFEPPQPRLTVRQQRLFEEIEDFIPWQEPAGAQRIIRNIRRLNHDGFHVFDLQGAFLRNADLSGLDLRGSNLQGADLQGANLVGTKLMGVNLTGANINDTRLKQL